MTNMFLRNVNRIIVCTGLLFASFVMAAEKEYFNSGIDFYNNGDYEEAREQFIKSNDIDENSETLLMMAQSSKKLKDYPLCLRHANRSISINGSAQSELYEKAKKLIDIGCNVVGYEQESIRVRSGFLYSEDDEGPTDVSLLEAEAAEQGKEYRKPITLEELANKIAIDSMSLDEILLGDLIENNENKINPFIERR